MVYKQRRILHVGVKAIWSRGYVNARYYEFLRRFTVVSQVNLPRLRGMSRLLPLFVRCLSPLYQYLYCTHLPLLHYWNGPVIVDQDDPTFSDKEITTLNDRRVQVIVTTTERLKQQFRARGVTKPIEVIPSGFSKGDINDQLTARIRKMYNPFGHPVVGYAGANLTGHSGPDDITLLLEAMERVWKNSPDVQLWLLGQPSSEIREYASGNPRIHLFGLIFREKLLNYLRNFTIATYPRQYDAGGFFRVKLIEYMGCGVPVVATPTSETQILREANAGLMASDSRRFADAILRLLANHSLSSSLAANGCKFAEAYDCDQLAKEYEQKIFEQFIV